MVGVGLGGGGGKKGKHSPLKEDSSSRTDSLLVTYLL